MKQLVDRARPILLLVVGTVGIPAAIAYAFADKAAQHPLLAVGLGLLYELCVLSVGLSSQIWKQAGGRWVGPITDWLDVRILRLFSRYYPRYCRFIFFQHRDFDVRGLSVQGPFTLELEQVFIQPGTAPVEPELASSALVPTISGDIHTIWEYLTKASGACVILGAPGSGKTTLLKHIALTMVAGRQSRRKVKASRRLPILLFVREQVEVIKANPAISLPEMIQVYLKKRRYAAPAGWFDHQLKRGRCLVMFDGLDEVIAPEDRLEFANWIKSQIEIYGNNRFIVTSRPFGYKNNPISGVMVLEMRPFTNEQVKQFIINWYTAHEIISARADNPKVRKRAHEGAEDLFKRLRDTPSLLALAANPLLLTMIATVHRYYGSLPVLRVELYAQICRVFLGIREQAKGLMVEMSPAQKQRVLQSLAYYLMRTKKSELPVAEAIRVINEPLKGTGVAVEGPVFLRQLEEISGLLVEREAGIYSFTHQTFQEYLAAVYIKEQRLEHRLLSHINDSWWHETIRLYCAQTDATPVITACLRRSPPPLSALALAIECLNEARKVEPAARTRLEHVLKEGVKDTNPERRRIVTEALLQLQPMPSINEDASLGS